MVSSVKLAELWQRLGFRVVVACMGSESRTERVSDTLTIYRKKDIFLSDPWNYGIAFGFTSFVKDIIAKEKPDHIIVNKVLFWTSLTLFRLPNVTLITDALVGMTWWPRGTITKIAAAIYAWTAGWLELLFAARIVFFHPQPQNLLQRLGVQKKSMVIPTGIDVSGYNAEPKNPDQIVMTYVGRLESVKGVDDFLAAAVPLLENYPKLKIQVVGFYNDPHPLVDQYHGRVHFTGLRKDIPAILAASDIFVLPSYSEGLSNALMEAMASSCACVASDVGGNRYLIQNGVSGFLFPAGDRDALQSHLRRLMEDPDKRASLGLKARERIDQEFSWTIVGEKYKKFFESLHA